MGHLVRKQTLPFTTISKITKEIFVKTTIRNKMFGKSNNAYLLSIRVQTTINHLSICFSPQDQRQRNCFLILSTCWKRHCMTHWCEPCCMDSYQQWQTSRSDSQISNSCGKKILTVQVMSSFSASFGTPRKLSGYLSGSGNEVEAI